MHFVVKLKANQTKPNQNALVLTPLPPLTLVSFSVCSSFYSPSRSHPLNKNVRKMATSILLSNPLSCTPRRPNHRTQCLRIMASSTFAYTLVKPKKNSYPSSEFLKLKLTLHSADKILTRASVRDGAETDSSSSAEGLVGEDSAAFELGKQKISSWVYFCLILGVVLLVLDVAWIDNSTGYGKAFIQAVSSLSDSHEVVMLFLILIFATVHSGLASLRDMGEKLIGERAYRVLFAGVSLPLAFSTVVYFINHRYEGLQLWQLQSAPAVHQLVWLSNFISFFLLYPSTFNLLEVAAVDKPKMHLWETGIMRVTRHPQMVGQVIWCLAHTLWIGNSVAVAASIGLISHHLFGVWNGDRRLAARYGESFEAVKRRTSIVPFAAILDGRQKLPKDYYKEFLRLPYLSITALTLGTYFGHPLMQAASNRLHW